jgi:hypothetical protein
MKNIKFRSLITLPRSGSHFLANVASTKLGATIMTTDTYQTESVTFSEYRPDVIKRGLSNPDDYKKTMGFNDIVLFSHPHHFDSVQDYIDYTGSELATVIVSFPLDAIYSLYLAMSKGYHDGPSSKNNRDYEEMTVETLDKLTFYKQQTHFIKSLFKDKSEKIKIHRYEDFSDLYLSELFGEKIENCGFRADPKRRYWSENINEGISKCVLNKIFIDYKELIELYYPEKLHLFN